MSEQMLSIIVTAAGKGTRFGSTRPKQFEKINKIPILPNKVVNHQLAVILNQFEIELKTR